MNFFSINHSIALFTFLFANIALAQESSTYSVGALVNYSTSIYKKVDSDTIVFPLVSYDSDTIFIKERGIGYHTSKNVDISIAYKDAYFDPDDSDDSDIRQLDKRQDAIVAKAEFKFSVLQAEIEQDISGRHDGFSASAGIGFPLLFTSSFFVKGSVGYTYTSKEMSQHLYSVSASESARTAGRITEHSSDSTTAVDYNLQLIMPLNKRATFVTVLSHTKHDDEVISSPLIAKGHNNSVTILASYKF